jgi:hypothetical protein
MHVFSMSEAGSLLNMARSAGTPSSHCVVNQLNPNMKYSSRILIIAAVVAALIFTTVAAAQGVIEPRQPVKERLKGAEELRILSEKASAEHQVEPRRGETPVPSADKIRERAAKLLDQIKEVYAAHPDLGGDVSELLRREAIAIKAKPTDESRVRYREDHLAKIQLKLAGHAPAAASSTNGTSVATGNSK